MSSERSASKRVLVVSFAFFPRPGAGHVRTQKFVKYLPSFGWEPTVLTEKRKADAQLSSEASALAGPAGVIEVPFHDPFMAAKQMLGLQRDRDAIEQAEEERGASLPSRARACAVKRIARITKDWIAFPDARITWAPAAVLAGYRELRGGGYDAIYSTSPPATNHIVACALQRATGLPWIADYRDLWSQDRLLDRSSGRRRAERPLERFVLRRAHHVVTVGEPYAEALRDLHAGKPVTVITNGFDPDDHAIECVPRMDRLVITYTGNLYGLRCDPRPVISVLERMIDCGQIGEDDALLRIFSQWEPALLAVKDKMKYGGVLEVNGMVPRSEALKAQKESGALLVVLFDEPQAGRLHSSKMFEYMGAGRPILAWVPRGGLVREVLNETGAGEAATTEVELESILLKWIRQFKEAGAVDFHPRSDEVEMYSRKKLTGELAAILSEVSQDRADRRGQRILP